MAIAWWSLIWGCARRYLRVFGDAGWYLGVVFCGGRRDSGYAGGYLSLTWYLRVIQCCLSSDYIVECGVVHDGILDTIGR